VLLEDLAVASRGSGQFDVYTRAKSTGNTASHTLYHTGVRNGRWASFRSSTGRLGMEVIFHPGAVPQNVDDAIRWNGSRADIFAASGGDVWQAYDLSSN
jgi:hypothetical protein